ncbi:hypothetical protein [Candidatus Harpocratesius sp.]
MEKKKRRSSIFDFNQFSKNTNRNTNVNDSYLSHKHNSDINLFPYKSNFSSFETSKKKKKYRSIFDSIYMNTDVASIILKEIDLYSTEGTKIISIIGNHYRPHIIKKVEGRSNPADFYYKENWYFHGTAFAEASNLSRRGFNASISANNNTFGVGFYISKEIEKSLKFGKLILLVFLPPDVSIARYSVDHTNINLPKPTANNSNFVKRLKSMGYDGIEVTKGVYVENWSFKNGGFNNIVQNDELCLWNYQKAKIAYVLEF